jgi:glycosyltransferase involved in cell wall biosynthesis
VVFAGERADVPNLIRSADFALIPSLSESGPLVLVEYMAGGLPFVSTRVGDVAIRVAEFGLPEFVPPNNTEAFAKALCRLLGLSFTAWQDRAKQGHQVALNHFDVRAAMAQWRAVYRQMLDFSKA